MTVCQSQVGVLEKESTANAPTRVTRGRASHGDSRAAHSTQAQLR